MIDFTHIAFYGFPSADENGVSVAVAFLNTCNPFPRSGKINYTERH